MEGSDLYHRLGGRDAVARIVLTLYEHVLDSVRLEPYFRHCDMRRIIDHQTNFLASLIGGPASYSDEELTAIHAGLGIDKRDFREMIGLLETAMHESGLSGDDIDPVAEAYKCREHCIVGARRGPSSSVA